MISLRVNAVSGHYRVPGQVGNLETATSFPIAPISTMRGFLESLVGAATGAFDGEFAYGWERPPTGYGTLLRRAHVWATEQGQKGIVEKTRVCSIQTYFDLAYRLKVRGAWERQVRAALKGDVERFGVLYLGESSDIVTWIDECEDDPETLWVMPGNQVSLPIKSGRGFGNLTAQYGQFNIESGTPAWFS